MANLKKFKNKGEDGATPLNSTNLNENLDFFLEILGLNVDTYSIEKNYVVGDIVVKDNMLYECITDNSDDWLDANWKKTSILVEREEEE